MNAPLNEQQIYQFLDEGYLLAPNLIPREIAAQADDAAWRTFEMQRDDRATWEAARGKREHLGEYDPAFDACYTDALLRAAAQLSDNPTLYSHCRKPDYAFIIKIIPSDEEWQPSGIHLDGAGTDNSFLFAPAEWQMFAMIYLHDVEPHGGGTVVWPRSHRRVQAHARSDPDRFKFMFALKDDLFDGKTPRLDVGEPVELVPRAGDVAFLHPMLLHAKPMNTGSRPRFALHVKW